jgi:hypothetical protein
VARLPAWLVTTLRLSDPELRDLLVADLQARIDLIVEPVGDDTIEVSLLGSYSPEAMQLAIDLRVRAWEEAQRAAGRTIHVELV